MLDIVKELEKLNKKAEKIDEIPVSAIIVSNNKIISKAYNKRNKKNDVLGHAEIIAIKKASKKMKTWILDGCDMYVTLEPCEMCREIIKQSRINNVYYFLGNNKHVNYKTKFKKVDCKLDSNFEKELKEFFKKKR